MLSSAAPKTATVEENLKLRGTADQRILPSVFGDLMLPV